MNKTPLKSKNGIQFGRCIYIGKPIEKQLSGSLRVNCGGSPGFILLLILISI